MKRRFHRGLVVATLLAAGACSTSPDDGASADDSAITNDGALTMTDVERHDLVEQKVTCPFMGTVVFMKKLDVLGTLGNSLGRIADVVALGDEGGGNLGSLVLKTFATGNHHRMHPDADGTGQLSVETPPGMFSLDFPGAQGTHPGHSGILEQGRKGSYHGALDQAALGRFLSRAVDADGKKSGESGFKGAKYLRRADIGTFIWENVSADPESVYLGHGLGGAAAKDLSALISSPTVEKVVKLTGTDNIVGSSGEFGLLVTLLEQPDVRIAGEPVILVDDVKGIFVDKKLPAVWNAQPKKATRWVEHTTALLVAAEGSRIRAWL